VLADSIGLIKANTTMHNKYKEITVIITITMTITDLEESGFENVGCI
jgi:hypothetical protein